MLVVFAIIVTITSVILVSQSSFNKTFVLSNTAYDVALSLRNAQTYGIGGRVVGTSVNVGYGLNFELGSPKSFTFFADSSPGASCGRPNCKSGDNVYTTGSDSIVQSYSIGNGIAVTKLCAFSSGSWTCEDISSLDIVFVRPNPEPFLSVNGTYSSASPVTAACIELSYTQDSQRFISISSSGSVVANATSCP